MCVCVYAPWHRQVDKLAKEQLTSNPKMIENMFNVAPQAPVIVLTRAPSVGTPSLSRVSSTGSARGIDYIYLYIYIFIYIWIYMDIYIYKVWNRYQNIAIIVTIISGIINIW